MLKRRGRIAALALALAVCAGMLAGCGGTGAKAKQRYQATFMGVFDTVCTVIGWAEDEAAFRAETERIEAGLTEYHRLYDIYNEYEGIVNLCTINRHPGETLQADRRIIDLLVFGRRIAEMSGGKTDISLGCMLRLWHDAREGGIADPEHAALPDPEALREAMAHTGFDKIEIDVENGTVRLKDPRAGIDAGALAKGYAVQRVSENVPSGYLLSVGGNVAATGPRADDSSWIVGIQDPSAPTGEYQLKVKLGRGSVVTSGDYQRLYYVDGKAYHHIIDPETLMPGAYWRSVTVLYNDSGMADALSTTLFLMNREEGQKLLDETGAEAMWIDASGRCFYSPGFEKRIP